MKVVILLLHFTFIGSLVVAQSCVVQLQPLQGEYKGGCKNGKAEGMGTASGIDTYAGYFKKGVPEGRGKYTWQNGDAYDGEFRNGLPDGEGVMTKRDTTNWLTPQVITGQWSKGQYVGRFQKPYVVKTLTSGINNVTVRKVKGDMANIALTVRNRNAGAGTASGEAVAAKARLIDIQLVSGMFQQNVADENSSPVQNRYFFRKITFPFYAILTFKTHTPGPEKPVERVGLEINENGSWTVQVGIDN